MDEKKFFKILLDNVPQGIIALNESKELVFVNDSALIRFGGKAKNRGNELANFIDDRELCEKIERGMDGAQFSFIHQHDGGMLSVSGKTLSKEKEEGLAYILLFTDVSGEREIIRQKSEFFANASHELKTPITVMRGLTEILLTKESLEEQEKRQIERIHKESLRMADLISDMLKLSKLERSEQEERAEVNIREIAEEVITELSERIEAKNLAVALTGEGKIVADARNIFEVVQNLCSNAVNYNRQDGWLRVEIQDECDETVLKVTDGGIGIEKEHIPRLCERFYRVDKSRSKKTGGTGLGLAIVKHICARYNAELDIVSELDEGTTVTVRFKKQLQGENK